MDLVFILAVSVALSSCVCVCVSECLNLGSVHTVRLFPRGELLDKPWDPKDKRQTWHVVSHEEGRAVCWAFITTLYCVQHKCLVMCCFNPKRFLICCHPLCFLSVGPFLLCVCVCVRASPLCPEDEAAARLISDGQESSKVERRVTDMQLKIHSPLSLTPSSFFSIPRLLIRYLPECPTA